MKYIDDIPIGDSIYRKLLMNPYYFTKLNYGYDGDKLNKEKTYIIKGSRATDYMIRSSSIYNSYKKGIVKQINQSGCCILSKEMMEQICAKLKSIYSLMNIKYFIKLLRKYDGVMCKVKEDNYEFYYE